MTTYILPKARICCDRALFHETRHAMNLVRNRLAEVRTECVSTNLPSLQAHDPISNANCIENTVDGCANSTK